MDYFTFICISILIIAVCLVLFTNCLDYFKIENFKPSIVRPLPCNKPQNTCKFPFTNNKLEKTANEDVYIYQYANRNILNPNDYMKLVKHLLKDLSQKRINIHKLHDNLLTKKVYLGDREPIIEFINSKLNELIRTKNYLQHNGSWKYEYFFVSDPTIYFFEFDNSSKLFPNHPDKFNLFKIIFTLGNPLRSSYTSCFAFITLINNQMEIQYTNIVNDLEEIQKDENLKDNLDVIPNEALDFSFLDTIATNDFDQYGHPTDFSGINDIKEYREGTKIEVKPEIPSQFKKHNFEVQHLPPQFGNGNCKYPPIYNANTNENIKKDLKYFNSPPLYEGKKFP